MAKLHTQIGIALGKSRRVGTSGVLDSLGRMPGLADNSSVLKGENDISDEHLIRPRILQC